jgi:NAD+ diphosphatase
VTLFDRIAFSAAPERLDGDVVWFLFRDGRLLLPEDPGQGLLPAFPARFLDPELEAQEQHYLGRLDEQHCCAVAVPEHLELPGMVEEDMRRVLVQLDEAQYAMLSRAAQALSWRRNHRYCSCCGEQTRPHDNDWAMVCPACGYTQYPRITPCVIMLVTRGDKALLARSARFPEGLFSCLAGFMEAGESAEHAVAREVHEETGIRVRNLRYFGSQSWPFPHSLMLGFHAEYDGGEIVVDDDEIVEAHWFDADSLPRVPPRGSIARSLIESWRASL